MTTRFVHSTALCWLFCVGMILAGGSGEKESTGKLQRIIPRDAETSLTVDLHIGTGRLEIGATEGGELFRGDFLYTNQPPQVAYKLVAGEGHLNIRMGGESKKKKDKPEGIRLGLSDLFRDEGILRFSREVPLRMNLELGAVKGFLQLGSLPLKHLKMETGVCQCMVDFNQPNPTQMDLLSVEAGVGKLELLNLANAGFQQMRFEGGMGSYVLDFGGELRGASQVEVSLGMGSLTLYLPQEVGVRIEVEKSMFTALDIDEVYKSGNQYFNHMWGKTEQQLDIHLEAGLGKLEIIWK